MKPKLIIISLISLFMIMGGIIFLRFYTISNDFSAFTGIKAAASLLAGNDIVELTGNDNQTYLMIKSESNTDLSTLYAPVISYLDLTKDYLCRHVEVGVLSCEKDPLLHLEDKENIWINAKRYTKYFLVFPLPIEKETIN